MADGWAATRGAAGGVALCGGGGVGVGPPSWERAFGELRRFRRRLGVEWWSLGVGLVVAVLGASVVPVVAGAVRVPLLRRVRVAGEARRAGEARGDAVIALCSTLAGEVRAGRQPGRPCCGRRRTPAGSARRRPGCWRRRGSAGMCRVRSPRRRDSRARRGCWGWPRAGGSPWIRAGLAAGLDRLEGALRADRDQRADLRAQLAGARATAVMLAGLPVLGLLLGAAMGADPLQVLLHSGRGWGAWWSGVVGGAGVVVGDADRAGVEVA